MASAAALGEMEWETDEADAALVRGGKADGKGAQPTGGVGAAGLGRKHVAPARPKKKLSKPSHAPPHRTERRTRRDGTAHRPGPLHKWHSGHRPDVTYVTHYIRASQVSTSLQGVAGRAGQASNRSGLVSNRAGAVSNRGAGQPSSSYSPLQPLRGAGQPSSRGGQVSSRPLQPSRASPGQPSSRGAPPSSRGGGGSSNRAVSGGESDRRLRTVTGGESARRRGSGVGGKNGAPPRRKEPSMPSLIEE